MACVRTYSPDGTPSSVNRPFASLMPVTVSKPTWSGPVTRPLVMTSVIAAPTSRMVVGGGADPSGATRRPDTRTAGTGRTVIVTSVRSSPPPTAIGVAAPAVAAAGKYVVGYTAMRPAGDGGGGTITRFNVMRAKSPTCCVRGCPSSATSGTPATKSSPRSVASGASRNAAGTVVCVEGTRTT